MEGFDNIRKDTMEDAGLSRKDGIFHKYRKRVCPYSGWEVGFGFGNTDKFLKETD